MREHKITISVALPSEIYDEIADKATKEQRSLAAMARVLITEAITARSNVGEVAHRSNVDEKVRIEKAR